MPPASVSFHQQWVGCLSEKTKHGHNYWQEKLWPDYHWDIVDLRSFQWLNGWKRELNGHNGTCLMPKPNGHHFVDIYKCIIFNENHCILNWNCIKVQLTISQHCFTYLLSTKQVTSNCLNSSLPHIWVGELCLHWFRYWFVTYSAPRHNLNKYWLIVNWTLRNKLQWKFNQNTKLFIHEKCIWRYCLQSSGPVVQGEMSKLM